MRNRIQSRSKSKILSALLLAFVFSANTVYGGDTLVLGVFPRYSATVVHSGFEPIARHLSAELGRKVILTTAKDQETFWENLVAGQYDIVHYNPLNYIESHTKYGFDVVAMNEEENKSTVSGALLVRRDSSIGRVEELRGKTILFGGGPKAMVSYWANVATLKRAGLNKGDYVEEFAKTPTNAVLGVYYRRTEVAGAASSWATWPAVAGAIDVSELRVLAEGEPLPLHPWAVRSSLGTPLIKQIQTALLKLNLDSNGKNILKKANLTGIRIATDADYDACRRLIKEVGAIPH